VASVLFGVGPHKTDHTPVIIDARERVLAQQRSVPVDQLAAAAAAPAGPRTGEQSPGGVRRPSRARHLLGVGGELLVWQKAYDTTAQVHFVEVA
jgi:hypothetical protein